MKQTGPARVPFGALLPALALLCACAPRHEARTPFRQALCQQVNAKADLQLRLMFGLTRPDGTRITDQEWQSYSDETLAATFPDGFSVIEARGVWRDPQTGQTDREPSRIVLAVMRPDPSLAGRVEAARATYRRRFAQQAVGLTIASGCESF